MAKAITEIAIGAAAIAAAVFVPGLGAAFAGVTFAGMLGSAGASLALSGVMTGLSELNHNAGGIAQAITSPIGPHAYIYGSQVKVGGVRIFTATNNNTGGGGSTSNNKQWHQVVALAAHPCSLGTWQLRVDGKQVLVTPNGAGYSSYSPTQLTPSIVSISRLSNVVTVKLSSGIPNANGTTIFTKNIADPTYNGIWTITQPNPADNTTFQYVCGGPDGSSSGGLLSTAYPDYKDKIYLQFLNGNHTSTFSTLAQAGTTWGASDLCLGRTMAYIQMGYDSGVFPSSTPNISFIIDGKNDILDPRTGTRGFTNNAALCIADYLSLPTIAGGFGLQIGTDIPTAELIAAANICDETVPLAAGGTTKRYTCNTAVLLTEPRGTILQKMLSSCAGRISFQGGTYSIFPGAWVSPSLSLTDADLVGPLEWKPRLSARDTANAVKGTYVSAANAYQQGDFPPYMQDVDHGFSSDQYLTEDNNERIFMEADMPCTTDVATAQRLAKIALLRIRNQGRGTLRCSMKAYQCIALDVIQFSHSRYGWVNKNLEVLESRLVPTVTDSGATAFHVELDVAETDSSIYDWSTTEELSPMGYAQSDNMGGVRSVSPPDGLVLYSGPGTTTGGITFPSTISTRVDGISTNSLYVLWNPPNDAYVTQGGQIEVQYQPAGASTWTEVGKFHGSTDSCFIYGLTDGSSYNVQIRSINVAGYTSEWVQAGPHIQSSVVSIFTTSAGFNELGWTATGLVNITYTTTNSSVVFTWAAQTIPFADGTSLSVPAGSITYSGLSASTTYYTYWYADATTGVLGQANANPPGTTPDPTVAAATSAQGRIPFPVISFTTLAATNPGTGGGVGGGGGVCPEANEEVETQTRGIIKAGEVVMGDMIKGYSFETKADVFRKVIAVRSQSSATWRMVEGHRMSPVEPVYVNDKWMPAFMAPGATIDTMVGTRVRISVASDEYNEQNYYLVNGKQLLIHNIQPSPC